MFPIPRFYLPSYAPNPGTIIRPISTFMHHNDSSNSSNGYESGRRSWESSEEDSNTQPSSHSSKNGNSSVLSNSPHHHPVISWRALHESSRAHSDSRRGSESFSREEEELIVDDIESPVSAGTGSSSHHSSNFTPPDLQLQELCHHIKDEQDKDDDRHEDGEGTLTGLQPKNLPLPPLRRDRNTDMISRVIKRVRPQRTLLSEHTVEKDPALQTHNSLPFLGSESKGGSSLRKWRSLNGGKSQYNHRRWKKGKKNGQKDSISIRVTTVICS